MSIEAWNEVHARRRADWAKLSIDGFVPDPRVAIIAEKHTAPENTTPRILTKWLDIGCGIALTAEWIARKQNRVWGFDGSQEALSVALHRLTGIPLKDRYYWPNLIVADVEKPWPYAANVFDVAL